MLTDPHLNSLICCVSKAGIAFACDLWLGWVFQVIGFPDGPGASQVLAMVKNLPANARDARDMGSIPGLGRPPGVENGNPLQYSCLKNPMDRGAWWATVQGVSKSQI